MSNKYSILCMGVVSTLEVAGCMHDNDRATTPRTTTTTRANRAVESPPNEVADADTSLDGDSQSAPERETVVGDRDEPDTRSRSTRTPTAQDQSGSTGDVEITRRIRRACLDDSSLSVMARNVTIITNGGVVTLRGEVESPAERAAVERHAQAAPGVTRVDNLLAVGGP